MTMLKLTSDEQKAIASQKGKWIQRIMSVQLTDRSAGMIGEQTYHDHVYEVDAGFALYEIDGEMYGEDCGYPPLIDLCPYQVGALIGQGATCFIIVDREHALVDGKYYWSLLVEVLSEENEPWIRHGEEKPKSRRRENFSQQYNTVQTKDGRGVEMLTSSHSGTVTENWCKNCQSWQTAKGIGGAFGCPSCGICWLNGDDWEDYKSDWDHRQQSKNVAVS